MTTSLSWRDATEHSRRGLARMLTSVPSTPEQRSACDGGRDLNARAGLFASIEKAAGSCDGPPTRAINVKPPVFGGFWATMHSFIKPLMHAVNTGSSLKTPPLPIWTDKESCPTRSLSCFFKDLSPCESAQRDGKPLGKGNEETINLMQKVNEHKMRPSTSFLSQMSEASQRQKGTIPSRGWFWWSSTLLSYLTRPSERLRIEVDAAINSTGLGDAMSKGELILGMHVRHGDSCGKDAQRTGRFCEPLSVYMGAVKQLSRDMKHPSRVATIYLATDSEEVMKDTRNYLEYKWLVLDEARRYSSQLNPKAMKWDAVIKRNREKAQAGGESNPNMKLASLTIIDVLLLSKCDLFVGKFSSNLFRTAYELHSAECDCAAPFVSLDHPWCFDWSIKVGGSNMTRFDGVRPPVAEYEC